MTDSKIYDAIIVGAGISGLSAAKLLDEQAQTVLVLEARNRVGGRTYTVKDDYFKYTDLGGSYIGPSQNRVIRLSKELGIDNYKVKQSGETLMYTRGCRWKFIGDYPAVYNPLVFLDINNFCRAIDQMGEQIPEVAPWKCPHAEKWDSMTVKEFIDQICWTTKGRDYANLTTRLGFAVEPAEISLLYFLWYIRCCDGFLRSINAENGGQERKLIGGSMEISRKINEKLGKEKVLLNSPVINLNHENGLVVVKTSNEHVYKTKYVIVALAPTLIRRISFTPSLSPLKNQLMQKFPMGSCIKTITFYKRPFWNDKGDNGYSMSDRTVSGIIDDTKPDGSLPALTGFLNGIYARKLSTCSMEERKKIVTEFYKEMFGSEEALNPERYIDNNWPAEEYSGGCYVGVPPPGVITHYIRVLREPHGNIYFAGTETATAWSGYMEGAIQAGERAAREVLNAFGKIGTSEIWQEEPESKDIPAKPFPDSILRKYLPSVPGFLKLTSFLTVGGFLTGFVLYRKQDRVEALLEKLTQKLK